MRVIRIYRWRCTDRAIEPLARHDVRCAKGPSLLAISLIYSGICWQGKNADTPFATVNPEGQARPGTPAPVTQTDVSLYAFILLVSGFIAGGVAGEIRKHVEAALREAETRRQL